MKTKNILILESMVILLMISVAGFSQESMVDLKSSEIQEQVFDQILNDHQLL